MAQFKFKLTGFGALGPIGRSYQLNDNSVERVIAAYRDKFGPVVELIGAGLPVLDEFGNPVLDEFGNPVLTPGVLTPRQRTDTEVIVAIFNSLADELLGASYVYRRKTTAQVAADGVTPDTADPADDNTP